MKKNIAIIGSGISGLTCAHLLHQQHNITLYEANDYIGGHTATKDVTVNGQSRAIDTGFIVLTTGPTPILLNYSPDLAWNTSLPK